jgi:hypothetical protein
MKEQSKFYIINYKHRGAGYFAYLNTVFGRLKYCNDNNLIPIVDWSTPKVEYYDAEMGENPFDYYFDQASTVEEAIKCEHEYCSGNYVNYPPSGRKIYKYKDIVIDIHNSINKFLKVKPEIINSLNKDIENSKTLGVHCRRSDMGRHHPQFLFSTNIEDYFIKTMEIYHKYGFEKIYLATEEIEIFEYFKNKIPEILLYQECFRIKSNDDHRIISDNRKNHRYLMGKEVLIDSLNLSKCNSLLCSISGVSYGSIFFNGYKYDNVYYFDEI